eukprot:2290796-Amphidinium_carterae.1
MLRAGPTRVRTPIGQKQSLLKQLSALGIDLGIQFAKGTALPFPSSGSMEETNMQMFTIATMLPTSNAPQDKRALKNEGSKIDFLPGGRGSGFHAGRFQLFAYLLGFVIVFRTQLAYQRYWEAVGALQAMAAKWSVASIATPPTIHKKSYTQKF